MFESNTLSTSSLTKDSIVYIKAAKPLWKVQYIS